MSDQLFLAFPEWTKPTPAHVELLRLANSAEEEKGWAPFEDYAPWRQCWKRFYFYPWKDDFLRRFAVPDGSDLQVLKMRCHGCDGVGVWHSECGWHSDTCFRCNGTGVFRRDGVWLSRWVLQGSVFHVPEDRVRGIGDEDVLEMRGRARALISGLVRHAKVDPIVGRRAFLRLLWSYDRAFLARLIEMIAEERMRVLQRRVASPFQGALNRALWWLRESPSRWADGLREWFGIPSQDDVPF